MAAATKKTGNRNCGAQEVRHHLYGAQQFTVGHDVAQRRVLQQDHQLRHEGRQHAADGLRQFDGQPGLEAGQADRQARFALAAGQGLDAGADDLREDRGVVEDQAGDHGDKRAGGKDQQHEQHHQDHGHAAQELEHDPGGNPDPGDVGDAHQAQQKSQREGNDCGDGCRARVAPMPLAISVQTSAWVKICPALSLEDPLLGEGHDCPGQQGSDQHDADHGTDQRDAAGLGAGDVVENRTHRAIATFRSTWWAR
jgi:hypothetical protein